MKHATTSRIRHRWSFVSCASVSLILLGGICPTLSQNSTVDATTDNDSPSPSVRSDPENVTGAPSVVSLSPMPATFVSLRPSVIPLESNLPSPVSNTSLSLQPTVATNSTSAPTTTEPSLSPTAPPSPMPSISMAPSSLAPSSVPTHALEIIESPFFSLSLLGMEQDIQSSELFTREWRNLMSQHVLQFWLSYGSDAPFTVARVITNLIDETRIPNESIPADERLPTASTSIDMDASDALERPDVLKITYKQEISVYLPHDIDSAYPDLTKVTIFTIPFELDGRNFTESLRTMSNNSQLIFLEYHGQVEDPAPLTVSSRQGRKIIAIVVTIVTLSLIGASSYIYYLMRIKEHHLDMETKDYSPDAPDPQLDKPSPTLDKGMTPLVGSFIGIAVKDNVLVSESYDEEFLEKARPVDLLVPDPESSLPIDHNPPLDDILAEHNLFHPAMTQESNGMMHSIDTGLVDEDALPPSRDHLSTEDSPFPSLPFTASDVESGEMSDYYVINYSTDEHSYHSSSSLGSQHDVLLHNTESGGSPSSPLPPRHGLDPMLESGDVRTEPEEEIVFEEHLEEAAHNPFLQSGFQIEIRDLE